MSSRTKPTQRDTPTSDLPRLAKPAARALAALGIRRLSDLTRFTEQEIAALHGMGPKALSVLANALAANGKAFKKGQ